MQNSPKVTKQPTVREWLEQILSQSGLSGMEACRRLGVQTNSMSLWKKGQVPLPLCHAIALAKMVGVDPLYARNVVLDSKSDAENLWEYDERIRQLSSLTANECEFIEIIRNSGVRNPKMNASQKEAFRKFIQSLGDEKPSIHFERENKQSPYKVIKDGD